MAVLIAAAATAAAMAVLAGGPSTTSARPFGLALGDVASSSSAAGAPVAAAPVVAASIPAGVLTAPISPAPDASVSRARDLKTAAFRPSRLVLPGGHSASVDAVGLHDDGSLVIPDDPHVVGWWEDGSLPGEPFGSVVVAGHVDSASRGIGVLAELPGLHAGQVVELASGSRSVRYTVVSAGLVPQTRLSVSGLFRRDGEAQLVLVTCGGPFDPVHHRYADNYVVVARPAP